MRSIPMKGNVEIAPGIFRLSFSRVFDFIPGQLVALSLDPSVPSRFYSIASGTAEPMVEILYDLVPEGLLTPRLARLAPGDTLLVSPPFGGFTDGENPSCWVAAGTGIAPFVSMVKSGLIRDKILVHGSRSIAGLLERGLFADALGERYFPCCSRENAPGVFPGRPTEWLTCRPLPAVPRYLVCGSSRLVVDARDSLIGKGAPFASVIGEIYF
jgi:ferredoxin--NADP+ reductase